jgi:hypothetical protein
MLWNTGPTSTSGTKHSSYACNKLKREHTALNTVKTGKVSDKGLHRSKRQGTYDNVHSCNHSHQDSFLFFFCPNLVREQFKNAESMSASTKQMSDCAQGRFWLGACKRAPGVFVVPHWCQFNVLPMYKPTVTAML